MTVALAWFVAGITLSALVGRHLPPADGSAATALKTAASLLVAIVMVGALTAVPMALVLVVVSAFAEGLTDWIDDNPTRAGLVAVVVIGLVTDRVVGAATARRRR